MWYGVVWEEGRPCQNTLNNMLACSLFFSHSLSLNFSGLFSSPKLTEIAFKSPHAGWFYNGSDFALCGAQLLAIVFIFGWVFVVMGAWFYFLNVMGWFRIDPMEEEVGMDHSHHKGAAYDITETDKETMEQFMTQRQNSLHGSKHNIPKEAAAAADAGSTKEEGTNGAIPGEIGA